MSVVIGFVTNSGGKLAHENLLDVIESIAHDNGWTTLRSGVSPDSSGAPGTVNYARELILKGVGLSGDEEIYTGFRSYQSTDADYYNMSAACMMGYVSSNNFSAQPSMMQSGIPLHNLRIDYWINCDAQRILIGAKVGTPVYVHGGVGKYLPDATPLQMPAPLFVAGMFDGPANIRFSDTSYAMPWLGNTSGGSTTRPNMKIRKLDGTWYSPGVLPFVDGDLANNRRDTFGNYGLTQLAFCDVVGTNIYGWVEGMYHISGFNNVVENTTVVDGKTFLVLQDVRRQALGSFVAMDITT